MLKKSITYLFILVLAATIVFSTKTSVYAAEEDSVYDAIDQYLQKEVVEAHIPGMSVVIVDKDKVLFSNTYGNCSSIDAPFIIGSNSKSFTATAIMQLVEQNKIDLDESIDKYLPSASEGDNITIRQLLNHTSGISTYDTPEHYKVSSNQGTYVYANANYSLLGQIIQTVSGLTYDEYVKTHIFEPLEMKHSFTSLEEAKDNGLIAGYRNYFGFMVPEELPYPDVDSKGWLSIPTGYIISSAPDMGKYLQFYLKDGLDILQPESIQTMFYDNVKVSEDRFYGFGWGVMNHYPEPVISHGGLVENYSAQMFIFPESEIAGVILINDNDYLVANDMTGTILYGVLAMLFGEEPTYINESSYVMKHLTYDGIYLVIVMLCILPLFLFGKWKKRLNYRKKVKVIISFTVLHIMLPTLLLLVPRILGTPMSVVRSFVPDFYIVLVGGAFVAYSTGLLKIIHLLRNIRKRQAV
ncbi:MAG TPA: serine hydrolase domain-containing protein [Lachnospiraceae bacterium]|nr:serine hydrolase domain-containing protein [Lachnospiraceae bacterium]